MKKDKKRFLPHYAPEIANRKELPVNIKFAQFYALDLRESEDVNSPKSTSDECYLGVKIDDYQTNRFNVFGTLGKPISKMIQ
jgi:hypothetical protein